MQQLDSIALLKNRLIQSAQELEAEKSRLNLPPVTTEQIELVQAAKIPSSLKRLILFLFDNQGSRTDTIAADCALGNVSDVHTPPNRITTLRSLGLRIDCITLKACNRFGEFTVIGHLFIKPLPNNQNWRAPVEPNILGAQVSANDE